MTPVYEFCMISPLGQSKSLPNLLKDVEQRLEDDVVLLLGQRLLLSVAQVLVDVQPLHLFFHFLDPAIDLGSVLLDGPDPELIPQQGDPLELQDHVSHLEHEEQGSHLSHQITVINFINNFVTLKR